MKEAGNSGRCLSFVIDHSGKLFDGRTAGCTSFTAYMADERRTRTKAILHPETI